MDIKCFTVLLFIATAIAMESFDPFRKLREKCRERMESKNSGPPLEAAAYLFCSALESNAITEEGLLNQAIAADVVSSVVPGSVATPIIDMCNKETMMSIAKTPMERVAVLSRCLAEKLEIMRRDLGGLLKNHEQRS